MNHKPKAPLYLFILISAVGFVLCSCQTQPGLPAGRHGPRMIFDSVDQRVVLFGGRAEGMFGLKYFNDLWTFDYPAQTWTPVRTTHRPPARLSPGMVYDPVNHQIILFGGLKARSRLGDTWVYHIAENLWEEVTPSNSPSARSDMGMTYDEINHIVILFGGYCQEDSRDLCDDTWTYNPETTTWTEMKPTSNPPIMYGQTLDYDPTNHQILLWGGHMSAYPNGEYSDLGYGNTIWRYNYPENTWQEIETGSYEKPPARYWQGSAFNTTDNNLYIFAGNDENGFLADTWRFNAENKTWEQVHTQESPPERIVTAIVFDPVNEIMVLFGGMGADMVDLQDTWVFINTDSGSEWIKIQKDK